MSITNLFDINDKVVVITGGTGVLGAGISEYLSAQGAKVAIICRRAELGEALVAKIAAAGGTSAYFVADVLDKEQLEAAREAIIAQWGTIDVLLNAAGGNMPGATIPPDKNIFDLDVDAFKGVVDLNLFGTIIPTNIFAKSMVEAGKGVVVNFCSMSALRPLTRVVGYGAAKAAIANYTKSMAAEFAMKFGEGFRVNAITPGFFISDQNRALLTNPDGSLTARGETIIAHTPFGRFGEAEELFGTIHYLISDASKFVTGTLAIVDGGFDAFSI